MKIVYGCSLHRFWSKGLVVAVAIFTLGCGAWAQGTPDEKQQSDAPAPNAVSKPAVEEKETGPQDIDHWLGTLEIGAFKLRLRIDASKNAKGELTAKLYSIDQGNAEIPLDEISVDGETMKFGCQQIQATFEGTLNDARDTATGTFTQFGNRTPLELKKIANIDALLPERPQMPKAPFNYESREVSIPSREAEGVVLSGTLTIPTEDAPFPAVVLVTGSGPQDRDESLMDHKPFLVIADYLSRHGIAVLRYDDRGIGKSTGNFAASTTEDFASDAKAVVEFLSQQKQIDTDRIGLIGHSEGGLIAAMLAASDERLAHAVMLAGPGLPGSEIIVSQAQAIAAKSGQVDPHEGIRKQVIELIVNDASKEEIDKVIEAFVNLNNSQAASDESEDATDESSKDQPMGLLKKAFQQMESPWFRFFLKYDPRTDLRRAQCPILALIGANDLQVLADLNIPAIETALTESGIEGHRCERLEGLNHLFQESESGLPTEYGTITQTISPAVLETITKWVTAH